MLRTQISLLKKELADMNENYEIISSKCILFDSKIQLKINARELNR
jgi:hypothetical protein